MSDAENNIMAKKLPGGVVRDLPPDMEKALIADAKALAAWEGITPACEERVDLLGHYRQEARDEKGPRQENGDTS